MIDQAALTRHGSGFGVDTGEGHGIDEEALIGMGDCALQQRFGDWHRSMARHLDRVQLTHQLQLPRHLQHGYQCGHLQARPQQ